MKFLRKAWIDWLKIARAIGNFQGQVLFAVFYFLFIFPIGFWVRFFSDPLNLKCRKNTRSNYSKWAHPEENLDIARKPY